MKVVLELGERRVTDMLTRVRSKHLFPCLPLIFFSLHFYFSFSIRLPASCRCQNSGYGLLISLFTCPSAPGTVSRKCSVPYSSSGRPVWWLRQSSLPPTPQSRKSFTGRRLLAVHRCTASSCQSVQPNGWDDSCCLSGFHPPYILASNIKG